MSKIGEMINACKSIISGEDDSRASKEKAFVESVRKQAIDKGVTCLVVCDTIADMHNVYPSEVVKDVTKYYLELTQDKENEEVREKIQMSGYTFDDFLEYIKLLVWSKYDDDTFIAIHRVPNSDIIYWFRVTKDFRNVGIYHRVFKGEKTLTFDPYACYPVALFTFITYLDPISREESVTRIGIKKLYNSEPFAMWMPYHDDGEHVEAELDIKTDLLDVCWESIVLDASYAKEFTYELIRSLKNK